MTVTSLHKKSNPAPKRRILVVDDNLDAVHSLALLLRDMGHEAQFAINGVAAVEVAKKFRPDLILVDMTLPDASGSDIAWQLKREPGLEHTVIVAVSGHSDDIHRKKALDAGCLVPREAA